MPPATGAREDSATIARCARTRTTWGDWGTLDDAKIKREGRVFGTAKFLGEDKGTIGGLKYIF
jgi:hypothetical protein